MRPEAHPAAATPRVGIGLAVYRPAIAAFREQLASIRAQTHSNWVCVLTLDSPLSELAPHVQEFIDDPRFVWVENPTRLGHRGNFARALQLAREGATFLACADQDDVWYPEKLEELVKALVAKPPLSLVHADMDILHDGALLTQSAWQSERRQVVGTTSSRLLVRNVATGAAMLMDAELAARYPSVPDEIEFHDHWYALVASFHGGVFPLHKRLHAYRQHTDNVVGVRPYRGFLMGETLSTLWDRRLDARTYYRITRDLARRARDMGLPLTPAQELVFIQRRDVGLGLLGHAMISLMDPPHAAACIALSIGKVMDILSPKGSER